MDANVLANDIAALKPGLGTWFCECSTAQSPAWLLSTFFHVDASGNEFGGSPCVEYLIFGGYMSTPETFPRQLKNAMS